ncbi:MAG: ferrochelatase [Chloroflexota bacterium]|nr:ferrochelatase [Chloroflexota bacterium]
MQQQIAQLDAPPEKWLEPYTDETLESLAHRSIKRPLIFSLSFVTGGLETLNEVGNDGRD